VEEGIGLTAKHRDAQRLEVSRVFVLILKVVRIYQMGSNAESLLVAPRKCEEKSQFFAEPLLNNRPQMRASSATRKV